VTVGRRSIGVFNVSGEYFAVRNHCPHQGGPLCLGRTTGLTKPCFVDSEAPSAKWTRSGEIIRCPWHAWEFDMRTGKAVFGDRWRVATYGTHIDLGGATGASIPARPEAAVPGPVETYETALEGGTIYVEIPV
jgi:3-phenylpropionate/trans-cinnamate dioxygenase ferredoxin subunit